MVKVGTGKYSYSLVRDWAKLPAGQSFHTVTAVAVDSKDCLYVFQRNTPPVYLFDKEGQYLSSWDTDIFNRPHGICIKEDTVYLTDSDDSMVFQFSLDGTLLMSIGQRGVHSDTGTDQYGALVPRAAGPFNHPTKMVPSSSGAVYISDGERNCRVHRFSTQGELELSWGQPGKDSPNQFHMPHSIAIDGNNRVYVCDRENSCVQVFSGEGEFLSMWANLQPPSDIVIDWEGVMYVSQFGFNVTHRYAAWPAPAGSGSALKDPAGRRTIRQNAPPRISVLNHQGEVLSSWGSRKAHGLCVDSRGDIYLALEDDRSVDKYIRHENG